MSSGEEILNPGELRRYVTVQRFTREQDETGGLTNEWTDFLKAWAKIDQLRGHEGFLAEQKYPQLITEITMRWRPGLDESMRIVDEYGDQYDIQYIADVMLLHRLLVIGTIKQPKGREQPAMRAA